MANPVSSLLSAQKISTGIGNPQISGQRHTSVCRFTLPVSASSASCGGDLLTTLYLASISLSCAVCTVKTLLHLKIQFAGAISLLTNGQRTSDPTELLLSVSVVIVVLNDHLSIA